MQNILYCGNEIFFSSQLHTPQTPHHHYIWQLYFQRRVQQTELNGALPALRQNPVCVGSPKLRLHGPPSASAHTAAPRSAHGLGLPSFSATVPCRDPTSVSAYDPFPLQALSSAPLPHTSWDKIHPARPTIRHIQMAGAGAGGNGVAAIGGLALPTASPTPSQKSGVIRTFLTVLTAAASAAHNTQNNTMTRTPFI